MKNMHQDKSMFSRSVERFGVKNMHQDKSMFSRSVERFGVKNMRQDKSMFSRSVERFGVKNMRQDKSMFSRSVERFGVKNMLRRLNWIVPLLLQDINTIRLRADCVGKASRRKGRLKSSSQPSGGKSYRETSRCRA